MRCRFCNNDLNYVFADLKEAPLSNSYLDKASLLKQEEKLPLKIFVCQKCWLVQVDEMKKTEEIFDNSYAYFSSMSQSWLQHSQEYVSMIIDYLNLNQDSLVTEIASNDGYLLQYMQQAGIPCFGIEPTSSTANVAKQKGIKVVEDFFGTRLANQLLESGKASDLILGNNVLAHVPNIKDFVQGLKLLLKPQGTITLEFPHLLNLIKYNQFDTIYHEHFSYLSILAVTQIFNACGLDIYNVEKLSTHGGSVRIYVCHKKIFAQNPNVADIIEEEKNFGLNTLQTYLKFQNKIEKVKKDFCDFLNLHKDKKIIAYGAAAKGNTLLNYCEVKADIIDFVVDKAPSKINKYLPGSHIPIVEEEQILKLKPDYIIILPWNIFDEITEQLTYAKQWGAKFVCAIPEIKIEG